MEFSRSRKKGGEEGSETEIWVINRPLLLFRRQCIKAGNTTNHSFAWEKSDFFFFFLLFGLAWERRRPQRRFFHGTCDRKRGRERRRESLGTEFTSVLKTSLISSGAGRRKKRKERMSCNICRIPGLRLPPPFLSHRQKCSSHFLLLAFFHRGGGRRRWLRRKGTSGV